MISRRAIGLFGTTLAATLVLVGDAHADTLRIAAQSSGGSFQAIDNFTNDTDPDIMVLQLADQNIVGLLVESSVQTSNIRATVPSTFNVLTSSELRVVNNTNSTVTATVAVGDTDFVGPTEFAQLAASGTWVNAAGSSITLQWFADPANSQPAETATDTPGVLLAERTFTAANSPLDSYSVAPFNVPFFDSGLHSLSMQFVLTLTPGGILNSSGQTLATHLIPEPSSIAMASVGLVGLAGLGVRRLRNRAR